MQVNNKSKNWFRTQHRMHEGSDERNFAPRSTQAISLLATFCSTVRILSVFNLHSLKYFKPKGGKLSQFLWLRGPIFVDEVFVMKGTACILFLRCVPSRLEFSKLLPPYTLFCHCVASLVFRKTAPS